MLTDPNFLHAGDHAHLGYGLSSRRLTNPAIEIEDLPLHVVRSDGGTEARPCAEALISERVAERILECGIMLLAPIKDRDAVRLVRVQSVANPLAPLAGLESRA